MLTIHKHFDYLTPFSEAANEKELAEITRLKSSKACSKLEVDAAFFADMVEGVKQYHAWRAVGAQSFVDFCQHHLRNTVEEVEAIVAGVKLLSQHGQTKVTRSEAEQAAREYVAARAQAVTPLTPHGGDHKSENGKSTLSDNVDQRGSSTEYFLRRIARDHPKILAKMKAGKYPSVNAAAVAAGLRKNTRGKKTVLRDLLRLSPEDQAWVCTMAKIENGKVH